ncbi:hypothetical protein BV25DRAFT_1827326 [Artomyces pyxidatus]|uniref:Uncharacterized protein n=1 Tax=Artomyces pyxidatus TaxID=48021 RepID=A0ACB8SWE8_9AGAM|nr:hypothetical protein BV25DRAFT_1827326 [Artomyces pyxidatus]
MSYLLVRDISYSLLQSFFVRQKREHCGIQACGIDPQTTAVPRGVRRPDETPALHP